MYHSNATVQNIFKTFENYRDISFLMRELHKVLTISTLKLIKILVKYRGVTVTAKTLLNALRKQKINNRTAASKYINATNRMKRVNFGRKSLNIIYIIINTPNILPRILALNSVQLSILSKNNASKHRHESTG